MIICVLATRAKHENSFAREAMGSYRNYCMSRYHAAGPLVSSQGCVRSVTVFEQMEQMQIITKHEFGRQVPCMKRIHYNGTNQGNKIGDIALPPLDTMWQMQCKDKYVLHGQYRIAVGGKTEGEELGRGIKRKSPDTIEPVFWHARAKEPW